MWLIKALLRGLANRHQVPSVSIHIHDDNAAFQGKLSYTPLRKIYFILHRLHLIGKLQAVKASCPLSTDLLLTPCQQTVFETKWSSSSDTPHPNWMSIPGNTVDTPRQRLDTSPYRFLAHNRKFACQKGSNLAGKDMILRHRTSTDAIHQPRIK